MKHAIVIWLKCDETIVFITGVEQDGNASCNDGALYPELRWRPSGA